MICMTEEPTVRMTIGAFQGCWNAAPTYHDQAEGDHDPSQQLVGYGVLPERIADGLIVAEETPLEGGVLRGQDEKRKPDCSGGGVKKMWVKTLILADA